MMNYKEINPIDLNESTFRLIGHDWMLVTAAHNSRVNTMTASWGGFGVLFNKNVAYIFVRPQRFTKEFVDGSDRFSLTFFDKSFKKELSYLGTASGKDEDKISKAGLTTLYLGETPYFEEARLTMICKKLYAQDMTRESFIDVDMRKKHYPEEDYHTLYIAEIEKILLKD